MLGAIALTTKARDLEEFVGDLEERGQDEERQVSHGPWSHPDAA